MIVMKDLALQIENTKLDMYTDDNTIGASV